MEPRIQYAKTKDGVSIAFWTVGEGMPLVQMPAGPSHAQLEWGIPEYRRWYERLAEARKVVRYDTRETGLSDHDVAGFSLDTLMLDLEAVVDRLGLENFALLGPSTAGPLAIAYAARHPERVSHLILANTYARASDLLQSPQVQGALALIDKDWELFTETLSHVAYGWSGEQAHRVAAIMRASVTPETYLALVDWFVGLDVMALLPQVNSPTLVLHRRHDPLLDVAAARGLASRIPDARLALLEGAERGLWHGDTEAVLAAIDEFLDEGEEAVAEAEPPEAGAFRTVLFTDVEGSTALTQRLGDAKAREVLREHERMVREALKSHGGSEVKTMGDGFMTSFLSATRALECAIAMQRAFAERNEAGRPSTGSGRAEVIRVRIGLNAGEPIAEEEDLYGTAVNLAARIAAQAAGGEVLASDVVRQLVAGKEFLFADRGEMSLRGFEDPVHVYEVRWQEEGA
jgi:class 3 adenylate cyclase